MVRIRFRSRRNQSQQRRICCYARKRYVIKAQMKQNWHISIVAWILSNHINEKSSYTSIKVSMDYLKLQLKSIKNMNISKNLIIFTITKIPPSNLPNKSEKEFLKSSYTSIKVSMDYLKLQPKSIQNMNIRKNLIIFTITKIPPSNLPNKSKKEFPLN